MAKISNITEGYGGAVRLPASSQKASVHREVQSVICSAHCTEVGLLRGSGFPFTPPFPSQGSESYTVVVISAGHHMIGMYFPCPGGAMCGHATDWANVM